MASADASAPGLAETFGSLQTLLLSTEGIDSFLADLAELAGQVNDPPVSCGITVEYDGNPLTVSSSDARARALDESQYDLDEGTCLEAMRTGKVVDVPDLEVETRWPRYVATAADQGLKSSLSLPLIVSNRSIGAMNLYSFDTTCDFSGETRRQADIFAAQASTALLLALRQVKSDETARQLEQALSSRSVIDQAMGIVMGQQQCSAEEAFALLRSHSQNNNKKLRQLAQEMVDRASGEDSSPPHDRRPTLRDRRGLVVRGSRIGYVLSWLGSQPLARACAAPTRRGSR